MDERREIHEEKKVHIRWADKFIRIAVWCLLWAAVCCLCCGFYPSEILILLGAIFLLISIISFILIDIFDE